MIGAAAVALSLAAPSARADEPALQTEVPTQSIYGGSLVSSCAWPTAVSLGGSCTGSLIHPEIVIYAAHCGDGIPWIRFGEHESAEPGRTVIPEYCEVHPLGAYGFGTDFAYCRLSEPVTDVAVIPPLMGCDVEKMLVVDQLVTMVGFGFSDEAEDNYGFKRVVEAPIESFSWDEVLIGKAGVGVCNGDSGGPALVQFPDRTWRLFGVTSWGAQPCGNGAYFSMVHNGIEWIETQTALDLTPCHDGVGNWDPGPNCHSFPKDPDIGGGSWETSCEPGVLGGYSASCGDAFDPDLVDEQAPGVAVVEPVDGVRFNLLEGEELQRVKAVLEVDDAGGWGVAEVRLIVLNASGEEEFSTVDPIAPFAFPNLQFSAGVWGLQAEATDRAGNVGISKAVVFGVDVDPPAAGSEGTTGDEGDTDGGTAADTADERESTPTATVGGCGCSQSNGPVSGWPAWAFAFTMTVVPRRRRASKPSSC